METTQALRRNAGRCVLTGLLLFILLLYAPQLGAQECARTTRIGHLVLGETADIRAAGEIDGAILAGRARNGTEYNLVQLDGRIGLGGRWQLYGNWDEKRIIGSHIDHAVTAGVGYGLVCRPDAPLVRVDFGFHHDGADGAELGVFTGQGYRQVSWQLGVKRSDATKSTRYSGALIIGERFIPLVFEAAAEDRREGWDRWMAWSVYPFAGDRFQLGLAYAGGSGLSEGRRHVLLRVAMTF